MALSADAAAIETRLRSDLDGLDLAVATDAYAVDGITPALVARPRDEAEIGRILRAAAAAGAAVIPRGSGSRMALGAAPRRYDLALDLAGLNRVLEYQPADLTVTVEAGIKLSELQAVLAERGQWLPLDPAADGTIGGILATNASGPARIVYGTARDLVIGLQAVLAGGEAVKSGGRVVKNVAGYDLAKLHIGALGSLGVIAHVSFKVAPLPARRETLVYAGPPAALNDLAFQTRDAGLAVHGIVLEGREDRWHLSLRLAGSSAAVERSAREAGVLASRLGLETGEQIEPSSASAVAVRAGVLPSQTAALAEALAESGAAVTALPTAGVVNAGWSDADDVDAATLERLRSLSSGPGQGALVLEAAPTALKQRFDVWGAPRGDFALMQRLKQQFDPRSTLNPGRYLGGL